MTTKVKESAAVRNKTAGDLMTREILFVEANMTLTELAEFLTNHEISGAVVRDERDEPVGVVSRADLVAAAASSGNAPEWPIVGAFYDQSWEDVLDDTDIETIRVPEEESTVTDIMNPRIVSVAASSPVSEVAQLMIETHLHRVLVEEAGKLVGILTTSDLLQVIAGEE